MSTDRKPSVAWAWLGVALLLLPWLLGAALLALCIHNWRGGPVDVVAIAVAGLAIVATPLAIILGRLAVLQLRELRELRAELATLKAEADTRRKDARIAELRGRVQAAKGVEMSLTGDELVERLNLAQARSVAAFAREELRALGIEA